ncbi:MAG: ABC transporter ATP-binding protein [Ruminococcaceae bacterium]|nr:ABC transporter ATP-binding protein [Oscillospiraceae bacterium]
MIEIINISKTYPSSGVKSLDDINLNINNGSILGLVGTNGAGKSTLLRILAGVYRPDSGKVLIDGNGVFDNRELKQTLSYLPDDHYFFKSANLLQCAEFHKRFYPNFSDEYFEKLVGNFGLDKKRLLNTFSKGMLRQCEVILALSTMPKYMLCDETFDGLDPLMRGYAKRELMAYVAEQGATVILSSHNLYELEDLCDHIALIDNGKLVINRSLDDIKDNIFRYQTVIENAPESIIPQDIEISSLTNKGKLYSFIAPGAADEIESKFRAYCEDNGSTVSYFEPIRLTLDEIFCYELKAKGLTAFTGGEMNV